MAPEDPTFEELHDLSKACTKLWLLDANRLEPGIDYELNLQEGKHMWEHGDVADEPLFTFVDQSLLERPTFQCFRMLLDNYSRSTGTRETVTEEELSENRNFLHAVSETLPIRYVHKWLVKKKKFDGDMRDFVKKLDDIWFGFYRREVRNDSSGFEHVFVGEERDGKVSGCHNWIQIYNEEREGRVNYRGYVHPKKRGRKFMEPDSYEQLLTFQFKWEDEIKPVSTSFIGVSPEFELALYTLCFLNGKEENHVDCGPYRCNIKCYPFGRGDNIKIGSAFPEALPPDERQAATRIQSRFRGSRTRSRLSRGESPPPPPPLSAWGPPLPSSGDPHEHEETSGGAWGPPPTPSEDRCDDEEESGGAWGGGRTFASVVGEE